jgi:hypothetical protein
MSLFAAIGRLIDMVKHMTSPDRRNRDSSSSDTNYSLPNNNNNGNDSQQKSEKCSSKHPGSSAISQNDGDKEEDNGIDILEDVEEWLPNVNSMFGDDGDIDNEPGKSFLEILFSFVLDPLTAIIKGIIQTIQFVITSINIATNLNHCAKWFVIHVFCTLVYIPISMLFSLLNLTNLEKKIWRTLYSIDAALYCIIAKVRGSGFHIFKFSDDIREICFLENVSPTNCSGGSSSKKKKVKLRFTISEFLGRYLFLFVVILFICIFIMYFGKFQTKEYRLLNEIPISFGILFLSITLFVLMIVIPLFTNAFLYMSIISVIPILFISMSFIFYLFTMLYSKDKVYPIEIYTWKPKLEYLASLYILVMELIVLLPNYVQYGIATIVTFVMFVFCLTIVYLVTPVTESSPKTNNTFFFSFLNLSELNHSISNTINKSFGIISNSPLKNKKDK